MDITVNAHSNEEHNLRIECSTGRTKYRPEGYPVLVFGDLIIFPSRDQLERLRDVVGAYLCSEPATPLETHKYNVAPESVMVEF